MPETSKAAKPPYVSYKSFINFFDKVREDGVPSQINNSIFGNASGSHIYGMLNALRYLRLITDEGQATLAFMSLVNSQDNRSAPMKEVLKHSYPMFFSDMDLSKASQKEFDDKLREMGDIKGSTVDKAATFFLSAAKDCGVEISPYLQKRKLVSPSNSSRKSLSLIHI